MKPKWIYLLLCLCATAIFCTPVSAATEGFESLPESEEFAEIAALQDTVLTKLNQIVVSERPNQTIVFTPEDIHWDRAYKLYIETNIYELEDTSPEGIRQALTNENAIWQLPLSKNGFYCLVDFSISSPLSPEISENLTEEERQRAINLEGKWISPVVTIQQDDTTYRDQFEEILQQNGFGNAPVKLLLGGMSKMRSVSGIAMDGEKVLCVVPLDPPALTNDPQPTTRAPLPTLEKNQVYSFEEMAQVIRSVPEPQSASGIYGGAGAAPIYEPPNYAMLVILTAACGIVIVTLCLYGRHSSKA